jgi:outer membrane protein assembly factor BamB
VTIDAHTGVEVAATAWMPTPLGYGQPVFDPALDLVYVGTSPLADGVDPTPGQLLALDAHTLAVKWSFTASAGIDGMPALNRTRLCVSDRSGKLYMFDTAAARL